MATTTCDDAVAVSAIRASRSKDTEMRACDRPDSTRTRAQDTRMWRSDMRGGLLVGVGRRHDFS